MSEDEIRPPEDPPPTSDTQADTHEPPPYAPDFELIGYLEEKEGSAPNKLRR